MTLIVTTSGPPPSLSALVVWGAVRIACAIFASSGSSDASNESSGAQVGEAARGVDSRVWLCIKCKYLASVEVQILTEPSYVRVGFGEGPGEGGE